MSFEHKSFCTNDPCESEATHFVNQTPSAGDNPPTLLMCNPCKQAFESGQRQPTAEIHLLDMEDTEDDEFFLRKAENTASYPGEIDNPGYWGPGEEAAEREAFDSFLDELATHNDEYQEIQDNKS